jgi:hypothetical protein
MSKHWLKLKCDGWRRQNQNRYKIFEKRPSPRTPSERERALWKKREELLRVQEMLNVGDLRAGMKR